MTPTVDEAATVPVLRKTSVIDCQEAPGPEVLRATVCPLVYRQPSTRTGTGDPVTWDPGIRDPVNSGPL